MERSFKDKVVFWAARNSKKYKILTPFIYLVSVIALFIHSIGNYFFKNGKRYISLGLALMFFFMCSSFSFPENNTDSEIYLTSGESGAEIVAETVEEEKVLTENIEQTEWIEDSDIISSVENKDLESTDNIDTFTLDDLLKEKDILTESSNTDESGFDKDSWNLILVNKTHPIPDGYEVPLATFSGSMKCDERVLESLLNMLSAAKKDNVDLLVCSPYRDMELQTRLFEKKINLYMGMGYSYMDAYRISSEKVTVPGASEHQIGMAFDIVTGSHATLDYEFADTQAGKWLKEHGREYGFILRYPRGKEYITGIEFEPWHYRYVGVEAATYIMDNELTLEEFIEGL